MTRPIATEIEASILALKNPERGKFLQGFFKTGKGEYGEGDVMLGLSVPQVRKIVTTYQRGVQLEDIAQLLEHEGHEVRLAAVLLLVSLAKLQPEQVFSFYLEHTHRINNWDLVDSSAPQVVGEYILAHETERKRITALLDSPFIWNRRIAIISMFPLIREKQFEVPIKHITHLINDAHPMIQTSTGWALRRIGDQDQRELFTFLDAHAATMPRISLRYAIEHLDQTTRKKYLQLKKEKE